MFQEEVPIFPAPISVASLTRGFNSSVTGDEFETSVVSAIIRIVGKKVPINIVPKAKAVVIFFIFSIPFRFIYFYQKNNNFSDK